jgi:hypothetical protein
MFAKRLLLAAFTLAATAAPALAGEGKFSALVFGDYYWMAANHDSTIEDMNGLWIRRVNLSWDQEFDDTWSGRIRLEANQPGDFTTPLTISAFIKDAWVKATKNGHAAIIGISTSPSISLTEEVWGYRALEKVPFELQNLVTSRDGGLALQGDFGENKVVGYHVMVGNGTHVNQETNTKKKAMGSLRIRPVEHIVLEAYGDYEDRVGSGNRVTYFGFAGYQADNLRAGVQYGQQTRMETGEDIDLRILSGFVAAGVSEKMWLVGRVDRNMDPNPGGAAIAYMPFSPLAANTFFLAGVDFRVAEGASIMPNVEGTIYDDPDDSSLEKPDSDLMVRLTFQGKF